VRSDTFVQSPTIIYLLFFQSAFINPLMKLFNIIIIHGPIAPKELAGILKILIMCKVKKYSFKASPDHYKQNI
jgi:hypothetical protein